MKNHAQTKSIGGGDSMWNKTRCHDMIDIVKYYSIGEFTSNHAIWLSSNIVQCVAIHVAISNAGAQCV